MGYFTIQEVREIMNSTMDDALMCPSCFDILKEWDGDEGEPNRLACTNLMCLDETQYPVPEDKHAD